MANLVLYRKYRPKSFSEIVGQEHIVKTLLNAIKGDMVSHAYLFSGPRGAGKTTMARLLAKAVSCEKPEATGEPCNTCSTCEEINAGRAIDLIEIDAASNRGIDDIRELNEGVKFAPSKLKYKVFVVDEAHQLTKEAANALLKTLEEPPAHA
ncbi:MAG TPA: AAA family ATPase, partial [candidate division CPR3 bacterium]|nr:AAA family ATPase [candidate division CPR3 bacterium]